MPKSKAPRKRRAVRHGIQLAQNQDYWMPINLSLLRHGNAAMLATSNKLVDDHLRDRLLDPMMLALDRFAGGTARFDDYWAVIQTLYFYAHLLTDALTEQRYRIYERHDEFGERLNDLAVERWLEIYHEQLDHAENAYPELVREVGERQKRTGKYGMTGDERRAMLDVHENLEEILSWCSIGMVFRAANKCCQNLERVETAIHGKQTRKENAGRDGSSEC